MSIDHKRQGRSARRKGRAGEQELARLLREHLGVEISRNLKQSRDGGHDLTGLDGVAIEVKRQTRLKLPAWWRQTLEQAEQTGRVPVLAYRQDRQPWRFVVALRDLMDGCQAQPNALEMTATLPLEAFCLWMRERM
ncbi:MAG: hypothetical protein HQL50_11875 [Magnetococcales bacterium]|nr:hypothetical protein [Magnetococcales bacterium]